jgi:hypothetical protein
MNENLLHIKQTSDNPIDLAEKSFKAVQKTFNELKKSIIGYAFSNNQEEIEFFKVVQPKFLCEMIYFSEILRIEPACSVKPPKLRKKRYKAEMEKVSLFYEQNQELYWYYISGKTNLDDKLFLNSKEIDLSFPDAYFFNADPNFCCAGSYKISQFIGYKKLLEYLQTAIENLSEKPILKSGPVWTGPRVWLIELVYALKAAGVLNKGKVDIKDIANVAGPMFQKDLGEYYRAFQEIRLRKKNRTVFLDLLKTSLTEYMDDADGV